LSVFQSIRSAEVNRVLSLVVVMGQFVKYHQLGLES